MTLPSTCVDECDTRDASEPEFSQLVSLVSLVTLLFWFSFGLVSRPPSFFIFLCVLKKKEIRSDTSDTFAGQAGVASSVASVSLLVFPGQSDTPSS